MNIQDMTWHRLFSQSFYKNQKIPMGEMSFIRDFVNDTRGDLHPLISKSEDCQESVSENRYQLLQGQVQRLLGQYFPYASYQVTFRTHSGCCGFVFDIPGAQASVVYREGFIAFTADGSEEVLPLLLSGSELTLIVTCRRNHFDVYYLQNGIAHFFHSFTASSFENCPAQAVFQKGFVSVAATGHTEIFAATFYIDCGVGQADLRPVCYEDGSVLYESGKVYLTFSIRMEEDGIQGIFSWIPGTAQLELTGALFFDCGDGQWRNYIASSLLYHRKEKQWYIWTSAFQNQRRLAYGTSPGDPRFGLNIIDVTLMDAADKNDSYQDFNGFPGDEDPDFYYSEEDNQWHLAVCRIDPATRAYRYAFFLSDNPFTGYRYVGCGQDGAETGGSFVSVGGKKIFACGNDFHKRANYRIYTESGMSDAKFDFDDGGFRGWGSIIPVQMGSRTRYFWITFDRHKGSDFNWSYGNIYCFEAIL